MKIDKMDLDLLETYARIAETRSFIKAAEALDAALGTASRKLTRLEDVIGQMLVRRSTPEWAAPLLTLGAVTDASRYHNQRAEAFITKIFVEANRRSYVYG